ncbi:uncharacterized protein LOC110711272 [Chenopodium quinoa]|uniref:uncharacterized protein LOC110711272 n=1 Tax=Chenopodium quinoa TaxID=63459 RepID=UPI000B781036|nr:uncharacterized protein LOC110711272 [Chenopodium quinoa]
MTWSDILENLMLLRLSSTVMFSVVKTRKARNIIDSIFDSNQVFLKDTDAISQEIISFYKSLLGTKASWLPSFDLVTMRRAKQHSIDAQIYLIQPVCHAEIDDALNGINNTKAPVPNASHVKDFRPIACCTVVYKLISKIITTILAIVIGEVINDAQAGFILGKHIRDNILIAIELIKGAWLRQGDPMSPFLYAISIEYLSRCLYELRLAPDFNFHPRYEKLSVTHMMFVDDLLMFSRADSISVNLLFQDFSKFSEALGFSTNLYKSEFYFGGISAEVETELRELLGVSQGYIPFRYLGVPLSSKKLTIAQCRPLVEKVTTRIQGLMDKHVLC